MGKIERYLKNVQEKMGSSLKVWIDKDATYPDGTKVSDVAMWNEFGVPSRNQPPRPFFQRMVMAEGQHWRREIRSYLKMYNNDGEKVMQEMGELLKQRIEESIYALYTPPLAPSTIKKKGHDKPLLDTHTMISSIKYKVEK